MRLDHLLAPESVFKPDAKGKALRSLEYASSNHGSDHKALIAVFADATTLHKGEDAPREVITRSDHVLDTCRDGTPCSEAAGEDPPPKEATLDVVTTSLRLLTIVDSDPTANECREEGRPCSHEAVCDSVLHFSPEGRRLETMRSRLRNKATVCNNVHDRTPESKGLPIASILVGEQRVAVSALIDSGAKGIFMPKATADKLGLAIDASTRLTVRIGDNTTVPSEGTVTLPLQLGSSTQEVSAIVLTDCPYELILGSVFFHRHRAVVDYGRLRISLTMPTSATPVHIPFEDAETTMMLASEPITVPAKGIKMIPVKPADPHQDWDTRGEDRRWGFIDDAYHLDCGFKVPYGPMRVGKQSEDSSQNYVPVMNFSGTDMHFEMGDTVACFKETNMLDQTFHSLTETSEETDTASMNAEHARIDAMSNKALDDAIASKPHLKKLALTSTEGFLTTEQLSKVKRLVLRYHRLWNTTPKPTPRDATECDIDLRQPFNHQARYTPMNPKTREQLRELIEMKLDRGIITPSTSPCSSSVLLVPKPNGGVRFCVDYRALNKVITHDAYTLPSVDENLANLRGHKFFSSLDMKEAFWNVPLTPKSRELTAFRTPDGLYMYKRMPMGLKTASAVFCRYIDNVLGDLKWENVLTYVDDLLVATPTFEEHINVLEKLFKRLDRANLTLGAKKCYLVRPSVGFLGHVVTADGVRPDPAKVKAIEALTLPETAKELKSDLGIMGYYRKFILNYSAVAEPLRLKEQSKWVRNNGKAVWSETETEAFFKLRDALTSDAILKHPDWDSPFEIHTDASHKGLGAVLCQRVDGKERVISYASRAISKTEAPYSTWELECLAMVWATRLFRMYLYNKKFTIYTDSKAAKSLLEANDAQAGGRLLRWRLALTEFDFDVIHRKGEKNGNADALSRMYIDMTEPYDEGETSITPKTAIDAMTLDFAPSEEHAYFPPRDDTAWTHDDWKHLQKRDDFCIGIVRSLNNRDARTMKRYHLSEDSLLFRKVQRRKDGEERAHVLVVPRALRAFVLTRYHSLPVSGHKGRTKMRKIMKDRYYWPKMTRDISRWVGACLVCKQRKAPRPVRHAAPATVCDTPRRWHTLAIDLVEAGATSAEDYKYILTVICLFSRYVIAVPLKSKRAGDVADALFSHVFAVHGKPKAVRSDEGKEFVNAGLRRLYRNWNIEPATTGGYRPWSNPVERYHRYLNAGMTMLSAKYGEDWTRYLQAMVFTYNASHCESTGHTPYFIMHGREPTLLEDVAMAHPHAETPEDIRGISKRLAKAYEDVRTQQERAARLNRERAAKHNLAQIVYKVGNFALYWEPAQSKSLSNPEDDTIGPREAPRV